MMLPHHMTMPLTRTVIWHRITKFVYTSGRRLVMSDNKQQVREKRQAKWQASKYMQLQGEHQNKGSILAMTFGLGLALAIVVGLALLVIIMHGEKLATASGGGQNVPVCYDS